MRIRVPDTERPTGRAPPATRSTEKLFQAQGTLIGGAGGFPLNSGTTQPFFLVGSRTVAGARSINIDSFGIRASGTASVPAHSGSLEPRRDEPERPRVVRDDDDLRDSDDSRHEEPDLWREPIPESTRGDAADHRGDDNPLGTGVTSRQRIGLDEVVQSCARARSEPHRSRSSPPWQTARRSRRHSAATSRASPRLEPAPQAREETR